MFSRYAASALLAAALFAQAAPAAGTVEKAIVHGASLEGALLGYSADREVFIYLPPGYRSNPKRRFPVVYSLHGFGGSGESWMKRPDVFSSIYAMSSCCLQPPLPPLSQPEAFAGFAGLEQIKSPEAAAKLEFGAVPFAMAAAWSPNPARPPMFMDLPTLDGKPQPEVIAAWSANTPLSMLHQYIPALKSLKAIAFDVGQQDGLRADNERLHAILDGYGIAHHFETFEGGHGDMVPLRFEQQVLPFFSQHLAIK